nr:unnamed protein product [Digitaria exilis]
MGAEAPVVTHPAVLFVPFPAQGHVTPMLQLARALAAHGVAATVAVPDFIHRRIASATGGNGGVALASIPSGIVVPDAAGSDSDDPPGFGAIVHSMEHHMPAHLERLLVARPAVACVVVDVLASWAVPVAARCGVPVAGFWPAMLASYRVVAAIPELIERGLISESGTPISSSEPSDNDDVDDQDGDPTIRGLKILPPQVKLRAEELPWLVGDSATQRSRFAFWLQTLHRARDFRLVLVNSFPDENAADDAMHPLAIARHCPHVLPIAPALLPGGDLATAERTKQQRPYPSMWRADSTCIAWLDAQRAGSVVYVSFGSWVGSIGPDKVRELALGLEATGRPFLWALRRDPSWRAGLPDGFAARVAGRGKVVDWAPQEDVLRHGAVGCYLTHCGWNSTMEAVRHGVPLLCYPVAGDQFINCAYITGPWGIGLRIGAAMGREDVSCGIGRVMDDEDGDGGGEGRRLREKVRALRERVVAAEARRAADRNVRSFVDDIRRDHHPLLTQIYSVL